MYSKPSGNRIQLYEGASKRLSQFTCGVYVSLLTKKEEEGDGEGTQTCSIRPMSIEPKGLFFATKEAFDIDSCSRYPMQTAIFHKIIRDLPWAKDKPVNVVVAVNKNTGM